MFLKKGDLVVVDLNPVIGSEQGNTRPCIVVQNNFFNKSSPTTIIIPLTSKINKEYPTDLIFEKGDFNLIKRSLVLPNQIRTISIKRIISKIGSVDEFTLEKINLLLKDTLDL